MGQVTLSLAPFARIVITPNHFPWKVAQAGESAHDDLIPAYEKSQQEGLAVARKKAKTSSQRTGWFESDKREPILSVRMNHKCDHDPVSFIQRACGHHFCAVCNGHVDPFTKNVAQGESPVIGCNRQLQHREKYNVFFQEFCPQARYSFSGPVTEALGERMKKRVERKEFKGDMTKVQYEWLKKSIKKREVLHRHWNLLPSVWESAEADPDSIRRVASLCQISHSVGDAFSLVDSHPSVIDTSPMFKELLALPGVYVITLDQCGHGAPFRGRTLVVTNQAWVFQLSTDCNSSASHSVWEPAQHGMSINARQAWAKSFAVFLTDVSVDVCPHCATLRGQHSQCSGSRKPQEPVRRIIFREFETQFPNIDSMSCELQGFTCSERSEGVLTVRVNRLGARWYPHKQNFQKFQFVKRVKSTGLQIGSNLPTPKWYFQDNIPAKVTKNAKVLSMPEPRFQSVNFPYRSSYLLESDDGKTVARIKCVESRRDLAKHDVKKESTQKVDTMKLLVTVFEPRAAVETTEHSGSSRGPFVQKQDAMSLPLGRVSVGTPVGRAGSPAFSTEWVDREDLRLLHKEITDVDQIGEKTVLVRFLKKDGTLMMERNSRQEPSLREIRKYISWPNDHRRRKMWSQVHTIETYFNDHLWRRVELYDSEEEIKWRKENEPGKCDPALVEQVASESVDAEAGDSEEPSLLDWASRDWELDDGCEPVKKGAQKTYKNEGKKERQQAMFPKLLEEVGNKKAELAKPLRYPNLDSRLSEAFRAELLEKTASKIGGTAEEQKRFFDEVLGKYPECFWIEGCEAPCVKDHKIRFRVKSGAVPVARQPIPLSPYDDVRVEYHIAENVAQGKLRKINPNQEQLPEWTTPVFVVDQDAKGLLGRMVCAYGPVNKCLELSSFPSADPNRAFELAAYKRYHTVVDAIWGYTQFLLTDDTKKILTVCSRSGLYEWQRMPFGPSPAPAEMQGYMAHRFGSLRDKKGREFVVACMDDLKISSKTFEEHIEHLRILCEEARKSGFEFKATKGQYAQAEIEFWGCICDERGRRPMPKKCDQLENWPIPTSTEAVNSFLCFVNYLREHMCPDWVDWERVLRPFRKKNAEFSALWPKKVKVKVGNTPVREVMPEEAFKEIRKMLSRDLILIHVDFEAAANPHKSGRPLEMFIDASDYGWCGCLVQRLTPQGAPKLISIICKAFDDTQLRWSAMERELYALWRGVVEHERLIKGFKVYCYIDHKNNIFSEAQLDNRRRSKKMSNWALELQCFDIVRVWIRGEANILADAPSRAPWENALAKFLPIPDQPVRDIIRLMYQDPEGAEVLIKTRAKALDPAGDGWKEFEGAHDDIHPEEVDVEGSRNLDPPRTNASKGDGYQTPMFGLEDEVICRFSEELGGVGLLWGADGLYPRWPEVVSTATSIEACCPLSEVGKPYPQNLDDYPFVFEKAEHGRGHKDYCVKWKAPVLFAGDAVPKKTVWFSTSALGEDGARKQAWTYFRTCLERKRTMRRVKGKHPDYLPVDRSGPLSEPDDSGFCYHGTYERHEFTVYPTGDIGGGKAIKIVAWDRRFCTFENKEEFCGNCEYVRTVGPGIQVHRCLGHSTGAVETDAEEEPEEPGEPSAPAVAVGPAAPAPEGGDAAVPLPVGAVEAGERRTKKAPDPAQTRTLDYWEPAISHGAWVRHHVNPRKSLWYPHEKAPYGPILTDLGTKRITFMEFEDGSSDVRTDDWPEKANRLVMAKEWVGETWFYLAGEEPRVTPFRRVRRMHKKAKPSVEMPNTEEMKKLLSAAGADRSDIAVLFGSLGIEKARWGAAQRVCPDLCEVVIVLLGQEAELDHTGLRSSLNEHRRQAPELAGDRTVDGVIEFAKSFALLEGLLMRRVFDSCDLENQLRLCVPSGAVGRFVIPGEIKERELGFREKLLLEYHNSALAGHLSRDKCLELMSKDYWWPGMGSDIRRWTQSCEQCTREHGTSGITAWTRTEFYTRPFRCIQIDTISCREEHEGGNRVVLTVICCFSRWAWLVPIQSKEAPAVAKALLEKVILTIGIFPTLIRCDNGREFVNAIAAEVNRLLAIDQITGSAYHPQSRGMVESMHRKVNGIVRGLVQKRPEDWEERMPYAQCILRAVPLKALRMRSPFEVVLGLRPKFPSSLIAEADIREITTEEYVQQILGYFQETHKDIELLAKEHQEGLEGRGEGKATASLEVGDFVLITRETSVRREGATRFQEKTYPEIFRIKKGLQHTFWVEYVGKRDETPPFKQPLPAARLIKLDLPRLELDPDQPRKLEIHRPGCEESDEGWEAWRIEKFAADGQVQLRNEIHPDTVEWVDLSEKRYRWLV